MDVKIAFLLFSIAVVSIECDHQFFYGHLPNTPNQFRPESYPSYSHGNIYDDSVKYPSNSDSKTNRKSSSTPVNNRWSDVQQNGFSQNQQHFNLHGSNRKDTSNNAEIENVSPFSTLNKDSFQSEDTQDEYYDSHNRRTQSTNKGQKQQLHPIGSRTPGYSNQDLSSTVNRPTSLPSQPGFGQSFGSNPFNNKPNTQNLYRPRETEDEKFEDFKPITEFSWNLFKNVNNPQTPNFVISPLAPQHLLSYLSSGAVGETKKEITDTVRYRTPTQLNSLIRTMLREPGKKELQLASALFVSNRISINPTFQNVLAENVKIIPTDFSNTEQFNREYGRWVAEKTKGVLSNARIQLEPTTRMLMSSAVYFKGEWIFKLNSGGIDDFYVNENTPVKVPMMKLIKKLPYGKLQNGNLGEWISLPYNSNDSMVIILPKKGVPLDTLVNTLNVHDIFDGLNSDTYGNVSLTLPKFKVESKSSLINPLQQMGIRKLFATNAQLPNIFNSNEQLSISNVLQQASLEVNEEGSIATSLTAFAVIALSFTPPTPDVEFIVNRPFVAMIIDRKNDFPYFIAKISDPSI